MSTEEVIREIVSKLCPFHGEHATIKVHESGHVHIAACCEEFHKHMENIITRGSSQPLTVRAYQSKNILVHS